MTVRVEVKSEIATSREPAKVVIYENDRVVAEVTAEVKLSMGADGGMYPCVKLTKNESADSA